MPAVKQPIKYDDRHKFARQRGTRVEWDGDPARGEWRPWAKKDKRR
jgi:hypothetical protein